MTTKTEAVNFRHMLVRFEDKSVVRYVIRIPDYSGLPKDQIHAIQDAIERAAIRLFKSLRKNGKNYGNPFIDKRICRQPGSKAQAIISVWDGDEKSVGDAVNESRAMLLMSKV
jgi:hypothetical protein